MAQYPSAAASDANLYIGVNNKTTNLTSGIDAVVTTIPVASTSGFPAVGFVTIDLEIIAYTSIDATNFLGATRAADGSVATSHSSGALVSHNIVAAHHNAPKDEIIAVEADLVAIQSALADSAPGATASTLLIRIRQIVTQIKAITGTANWYDAVVANLTQKASTALSNLASVAINTSLLPDVDDSINLGSALKRWASLFAKDVDAGASGTAGTVDVFPVTAASGKIQITAANSAGDTTTTITNASQAGARTYTVPDAGASASFVMTEGTQTINGSKTIGANLSLNSNKITSLANGTAAADAAAFGQIKLVSAPIMATGTTTTSTTSATFTDTVITASITPTSASNRVFIWVTTSFRTADLNSTDALLTLARGGTNLGGTNGFLTLKSADLDAIFQGPAAVAYIDSPATTSSTTYTVQIRSTNGVNAVSVNPDTSTWVIILAEVV